MKGMFLLFTFIIVGFAVASKAPLTLLNDPKARCLDGTQAGFYAQVSTNKNDRNKWIIYLNGGGECDQKEACESATHGALGSSKYFSNTSDPSGWYLASDYCPYNPDFCTWSRVMNPYCTQDLHAGQITTPSSSTWGLYFSGHLIIKAMLDALDKTPYNLLEATDIIVHGMSAGGIGVWMNVGYIAKRYPKARVTAVPIAGHYFYATFYEGLNHTNEGMADFREAAFPRTYTLYNAYVEESCKTAYEQKGLSAGACMLSNNSFPFIAQESFVVQAQTDQVVLTGHDQWPEKYMYEKPEQEFIKQWYSNMTVALKPLLDQSDARHGAFAAACYTHGDFTHSHPLLSGQNYYSAVANWYFRRTSPQNYKLSDTCGVMCNPTCHR
eukprot:TRINITY_DN4726_c0_g1_i1.p1 TRINITY_DN4726_c0_g1~~TRINITY_DN4726_c0_g1_i1.p1  ORF type:complete len:382 (+),score=66.58 TRINITY_DN4726_c0_g1_i1:101-1246(+)